MSTTITKLPAPIFPTSTANLVQYDKDVSGSTGGKFLTNNWQLFGGSYLLQTTSNDMKYGTWVDALIAENVSSATFFNDVIKKYYDYDGYVLQMTSQMGTTISTDEVYSCIQSNPEKTDTMTCAMYSDVFATA